VENADYTNYSPNNDYNPITDYSHNHSEIDQIDNTSNQININNAKAITGVWNNNRSEDVSRYSHESETPQGMEDDHKTDIRSARTHRSREQNAGGHYC